MPPEPHKYRVFRVQIRMALLNIIDALERLDDIEPRTAQLRKWYKEGKIIQQEIAGVAERAELG